MTRARVLCLVAVGVSPLAHAVEPQCPGVVVEEGTARALSATIWVDQLCNGSVVHMTTADDGTFELGPRFGGCDTVSVSAIPLSDGYHASGRVQVRGSGCRGRLRLTCPRQDALVRSLTKAEKDAQYGRAAAIANEAFARAFLERSVTSRVVSAQQLDDAEERIYVNVAKKLQVPVEQAVERSTSGQGKPRATGELCSAVKGWKKSRGVGASTTCVLDFATLKTMAAEDSPTKTVGAAPFFRVEVEGGPK